ncbi:hypothetical protein GCM10009805_03450 [Leucobacter chromiireducens subsp. solipictus]
MSFSAMRLIVLRDPPRLGTLPAGLTKPTEIHEIHGDSEPDPAPDSKISEAFVAHSTRPGSVTTAPRPYTPAAMPHAPGPTCATRHAPRARPRSAPPRVTKPTEIHETPGDSEPDPAPGA